MSVDASRVYAPPSKLQVPEDDAPASNNSDSALSAPDTEDDNDSEASSSPTYAKEPPRGGPPVVREGAAQVSRTASRTTCLRGSFLGSVLSLNQINDEYALAYLTHTHALVP